MVVAIDVKDLKEYLIDNPNKTQDLLEAAGFYNITSRGDEFRCGRDIDTNPTSVRVVKETLSSTCFSTNISGDIITLISEKLELNFKDTLSFVKSKLGLSDIEFNKKSITLPFGGYYKNIGKSSPYDSYIEPIDTSEFDHCVKLPNNLFLKDGISLATQRKFNLMYEPISNRIVIPYWSVNGDLIGAMGRYNGDTDENKYIPVIRSFPKSKTLYGFHQNYSEIIKRSVALIGESEKFVMQLDTMGLPIGLGLGGSVLTDIRVKNLLSLQVKYLILAYDEGVDEEIIRENALKLSKKTPFINCKVGYIYDRDNIYLKAGSKLSPTDQGIDVLKGLLKECITWV